MSDKDRDTGLDFSKSNWFGWFSNVNNYFDLQVRTSYLPNEILWGHIFDHNVLVYDKKLGMYQIMHSRINKTAMDDTPRISAYQLLQR